MHTQIAMDWNCTPKIHMFKHQLSIWWYLKMRPLEVIRFRQGHEGGALMMGIDALYKTETPENLLPLWCENTVRKGLYLQTRMRALTKTWSHWQPGLYCLPASGWLGHSVYILVWQLELTNVHILLVLFLWIQMPSFSVSETISITLTFSVLETFEKSHPQNNFLFEVSLIASCVSYEAAHLFRFYISSGVNYFLNICKIIYFTQFFQICLHSTVKRTCMHAQLCPALCNTMDL